MEKTKSLFGILFVLSLMSTGLYFTYQSCVVSIALLFFILYAEKKNDGLVIRKNYSFFFFLILTVFYLASPLWAVDSQMAIWGLLKFLPLLLYALILMQKAEICDEILPILPVAGVLMTVIAMIGAKIPMVSGWFSVNGRLAGTLQYPNTFALFLLLSLIYLVCQKSFRVKEGVQALILIAGIVLSGSRTVYVMLPVSMIAAIFLTKEKKNKQVAIGLTLCLVLSAFVLLLTRDNAPAERILSISLSESTFLGRLLYWKDALPVILKHPFGLGYMGYYFAQGGFQTGVYSVTHVHNEFLQVFLDVGWIPGVGFLGMFIYGFYQAKAGWKRLLLAIMGAHCLMDFDLQYVAIYMVLMTLLPWEGEKLRTIRIAKAAKPVSGAVAVLLVYFAIGSSGQHFGNGDIANTFYPKNTLVQLEELKSVQDPELLRAKADDILEHNDSAALAWSAKARVDFAEGNVEAMMQEKKRAIALSRYTIEEYADYLQMLITAAQIYRQNGDNLSAEYCVDEAMRIPDMLKEVKTQTDNLAYNLNDKPELDLPEEEQVYLDALARNIL